MLDLRFQVEVSLNSHLFLIRLQLLAAFEVRHINVHDMWCANDVIIDLSHPHASEHI